MVIQVPDRTRALFNLANSPPMSFQRHWTPVHRVACISKDDRVDCSRHRLHRSISQRTDHDISMERLQSTIVCRSDSRTCLNTAWVFDTIPAIPKRRITSWTRSTIRCIGFKRDLKGHTFFCLSACLISRE